MIDLSKMSTEGRNSRTLDLDIMPIREALTVMNEEDQLVPLEIKEVIPQIEQAVTKVIEAFKQGGRLIYLGAGTSGRLGVLDAVECPPTFGTSPEQVVGLIAGGEKAFVKAVEGAEDDQDLGVNDLKNLHLTPKDVVVGIAASGRTPYVIGALKYAKSLGCPTIAISCNKDSQIGKISDIPIEVIVGPEVVTGSTRLKAGTAQKLVLNMISTISMVGVGKVYHNLMVDVQQTNQKLQVRAENIVMEATGAPRDKAREALNQANGSAKVAITMLLLNCDSKTAQAKLSEAQGKIRNTLT